MPEYGTEYFEWKKPLATFGGKANLFKFIPYIRPEDRVLDFGCGGGFLLHDIQCAAKAGVEVNPSARNHAEQLGLKVFTDVREVPNEFATVVISNHVLEHTECPLEVLRSLVPKIRDDGRVVFVVPHQRPNEQYVETDRDQHLYTWNPLTLGNLFKAAGYVDIKVDSIRHMWPPFYLQIYRILGTKGFHKLCKLCAFLRANYQFRVVAKKPATARIDSSD